MPITHTNAKGQTFSLHQGTTKTGKPKYYFAMQSDGVLANTIPQGYEIYENPNAQVFLTGPGPTLDGDAHPLQSGGTGHAVQGAEPPPPPQFLPWHGALLSYHRPVVCGPCPHSAHGLMRLHALPRSPAAGRCPCALDASTSVDGRREMRPKRPWGGVRCVRFSEPTLPPRRADVSARICPRQKPLQYA